MQTFLGAVADPSMQQMVQPGLQALGNANMGPQQVNAQINAVAAPQQMGSKVGPSRIDQAREDFAFKRLMMEARKHMPAEQADGWESAVQMVRAGVPKEQVDFLIPLNAKETMDLLETQEKVRGMRDTRESGLYAQERLKSWGIDVPPEKAVEMLNKTIEMKQSFNNAWALQAERERRADSRMNENNQRADSRALLSRQTELEKTLNAQFQGSPVVRAAQQGVKEIVRIRELSTKKNGLADKGMVYSYIKMLDDMTGVREGETKDTAKAASAAERVQGLIGRWKEGDLLTDAQRERLVDASEAIVASHRDRTFKDYYDWVVRNAKESGLDVNRVAYNPYANLESVEKFRARSRVEKAGIR
jgi:hypothetical protein